MKTIDTRWVRRFCVALVFFAITTGSLTAQFREHSRSIQYGNTDLRSMAVGAVIPSLGSSGDLDGWDEWSSSYLKPDHPAPPEPKLVDSKNDDDDEQNLSIQDEHDSEVAQWAFQYSARALADHDVNTCWAEGVDGNGEGEVVLAQVDTQKPVFIRNGFQRSPSLFAKNGRVRKARVFVIQAGGQMPSQFDSRYVDLKVVTSQEVELSDSEGWQRLPIPENTPVPLKLPGDEVSDTSVSLIAVQILSVYPGTTYQDTCISDIDNH